MLALFNVNDAKGLQKRGKRQRRRKSMVYVDAQSRELFDAVLAPRLCGLLGFLDNEKILESRATNLNTLKPYSIGTDNHLTARHALSKRPA